MPRSTTLATALAALLSASLPEAQRAPPDSRAADEPTLAAAGRGSQMVVIDPGHGGEDVGARGPAGLEEKQVVLDLARRVKDVLETRPGIRVLLTRDEDLAVSLDQRAERANGGKGDLFLSLHATGVSSSSGAGLAVYHLGLDGRETASLGEADAPVVLLPVAGGGTRALAFLEWDRAQTAHAERSSALATLLDDVFRQRKLLGPRDGQRAPLRVLSSVNMPAAFIEMGYLTDLPHVQEAASDQYQLAVAQAVTEAVVQFRRSRVERRAR